VDAVTRTRPSESRQAMHVADAGLTPDRLIRARRTSTTRPSTTPTDRRSPSRPRRGGTG